MPTWRHHPSLPSPAYENPSLESKLVFIFSVLNIEPRTSYTLASSLPLTYTSSQSLPSAILFTHIWVFSVPCVPPHTTDLPPAPLQGQNAVRHFFFYSMYNSKLWLLSSFLLTEIRWPTGKDAVGQAGLDKPHFALNLALFSSVCDSAISWNVIFHISDIGSPSVVLVRTLKKNKHDLPLASSSGRGVWSPGRLCNTQPCSRPLKNHPLATDSIQSPLESPSV